MSAAPFGATLNGSAVAGEDDRILRVAVPRFGSFQKTQLEKTANKQLVMELIREAFGRPLGVRFEPAPEGMIGASTAPLTGAEPPRPVNGGGDAATGSGTPPSKPGRGKADVPTASPEGIRRIVDLFGGDVIGPA